MSRITSWIIFGLLLAVSLSQTACKPRLARYNAVAEDLVQFLPPDFERNAIRRNRVIRMDVLDSAGRELGYSQYDSLGRVLCNVSRSLLSTATCYHYHSKSGWPAAEVEHSDTGPKLILEQYFIFPETQRLYVLKVEAESARLVESTCYRYNGAYQLQEMATVKFDKKDSTVTKYAYEGGLLKNENARVFAIAGGIADQEVQQGLRAMEATKTYFYSSQGSVDSIVERLSYKNKSAPSINSYRFDSLGLKKTLLVIRPGSQPITVFYKWTTRNHDL